jgi:hypothetical protein
MRSLTTLLVLLLFTFRCSYDDAPVVESNCLVEVSTEVPGWLAEAEGLLWLADKIEASEASPSAYQQYLYVQQARYMGHSVFIFGNCCPDCASDTPIYTCTGETLCANLPDCPELEGALQERRLIWLPDYCRCTF